MATNQTPNYQLSQWDATDPVIREDFNADNQKIDDALVGKAETTALSALFTRVADLESTTASLGNCHIVLGSSLRDLLFPLIRA